jgi:curved DNA-binding protein CbpA
VQNFYQLLSVEPGATPEEIKRAFRSEIARYHPDKVQHLGKEFQEMAASRAAALTEAYRTLMNADLRAEYDRAHGAVASGASAAASPPSAGTAPGAPAPPPRGTRHDEAQPPDNGESARSRRFASERRDRDDFVRKATLGRFRQALAAEMGQVEERLARGFDLDVVTRSKKLFSRGAGQRIAVKVVPHVDRQAVQDAWSAAAKAAPICVFLMGSGIAPAAELAEAIAELRKRTRGTPAISVVPIDVRDWTAHVPADAPDACRNLLKRLRDTSIV